MLLAKRIKAIRLHQCITQEEMADKLQVSQSTYSGYEHEAANLSFKTLQKLAQALGCSVPFLVDIHSEIVDETKWNPHR